jgi:hypothetical protein
MPFFAEFYMHHSLPMGKVSVQIMQEVTYLRTHYLGYSILTYYLLLT